MGLRLPRCQGVGDSPRGLQVRIAGCLDCNCYVEFTIVASRSCPSCPFETEDLASGISGSAARAIHICSLMHHVIAATCPALIYRTSAVDLSAGPPGAFNGPPPGMNGNMPMQPPTDQFNRMNMGGGPPQVRGLET